jgi:uncharacterized protein (TIGR02145 family)
MKTKHIFRVFFVNLLTAIILITDSCKKSEDNTNIAPPSETVTDLDGNVYNTIKIGSQVWLQENLSVTHYRNGDPVPFIIDNNQWLAADSGAYSNYNNDAALVSFYGRLYNWYAVNDSRLLSPVGWHIPTDNEWKILELYLGMTTNQADSVFYRGTTEGGKLKESGTVHWTAPNTGATNSTGFNGLPGGYRSNTFLDKSTNGYWWTSSKASFDQAIFRSISYDKSGIVRSTYHMNETLGLSIRCVKD